MIIDIESNFTNYTKRNPLLNIKVSYYNDIGKIGIINKKIESPQIWDFAKREKDIIDGVSNWDGKPVKRVPLKKNPTKFQLLDIIFDSFSKDEIDLITKMNMPNIQSIDIETEVVDGFPDAQSAKSRITTIAIATQNKTVLVLGWKELSHIDLIKSKKEVSDYLKDFGDWKLIYKKFDDEVSMMKFFVNNLMPNMSMIIGWHYFDYDWLYIVNRCKIIGVDITKSSPSGKLGGSNSEPLHIGMMDYLNVYEKYDRSVKVKESNKLDYVAEQVLGVRKLTYEGSIKTLFLEQFPKYVSYNAIDAVLVLLIHEKLKTINAPLMIANQNMIPLSRVMSPVQVTENMLYFGYRKIARVVVGSNKVGESTSYIGGYVQKPVLGMSTDVVCLDFASLYPSIIRLLNLSPESFIGVFKDSETLNFYKSNKDYIVSETGAVFDRTKVSVLKTIVDDLYADRKYYKKRYLEIKTFLTINGVI